MKIQQQVLKEGLTDISRFIESRVTLPVLAHVKLECADKKLTLTGTNLEACVVKSVVCHTEPDEEWATTVPFSLFNEYVGSLSGEIDLVTDATSITVTCGKSEATMKTVDAEEFPLVPVLPETKPMLFECDELTAQLASVVFAAATDQNRPVLTGVYLKSNGEKLTSATADGYRMAVYTTKREGEPFALIVPATFVSALLGVISKNNHKQAQVYAANNQAFFVLDDSTQMITQLIEGNFPDYTQILPKSHTVRAIVDKSEMAREVKRMGIFARQSDGILQIEYAADQIRLTANTVDVGESEGFVKTNCTGEFFQTAANYQYLLDAVLACGNGKIVLEQDGKARPLKLYPESYPDNTQVVMPMHIKEQA